MTRPTETGAEHPDRPSAFGDAAAEMANETEVEVPLPGASAPAGPTPGSSAPGSSTPIGDDGSVGPIPGDADSASETAAPVPDGERDLDVDLHLDEDEGLDEGLDEGRAEPTSDDQLVERTADLQRLQAEFLNYKRRVERDRGLIAENATYKVLQPILEVLDTIDRAREHGELEGGFKSVAEQLERVVTGLGLTKFGAPGDAFDPTIHEALSHIGEDAEVAVTTAKIVAKSGYKINDRVVRAAQVLVVDPETPTA